MFNIHEFIRRLNRGILTLQDRVFKFCGLLEVWKFDINPKCQHNTSKFMPDRPIKTVTSGANTTITKPDYLSNNN